jgi:hypothetical protein
MHRKLFPIKSGKKCFSSFVLFVYTLIVILNCFHHHPSDRTNYVGFNNTTHRHAAIVFAADKNSSQQCTACEWEAIASSPHVAYPQIVSNYNKAVSCILITNQNPLKSLVSEQNKGRAPPVV